jgi:hypothetical protein
MFASVCCALLLSMAAVAAALGPSVAAQSGDCRQSALEKLKALAPESFSVYASITDKKFFLRWISCDDLQLGLATAVHESVHHLTEDHDAFPLLDGHALPRPHEVSKFFAPSAIAGRFDRNDGFASTYLHPGRASSSSDFLYLLDEMNAYTHDLNAAISLTRLRPPHQQVEHRAGLASLMAFVAVYVETAEESHPATWTGLHQIVPVFSELWTQAETILEASCRVPDLGADDQTPIRQLCGQKPRASLAKILGRVPVCPTECLGAKSASRK